MMSVRAKTLLLILVMVVGAMGGAPLSAAEAHDEKEFCGMKCCEKAAKATEENQTRRPNFCRLMNCGESIPAAPSGAPVQVAVFTPAEKIGYYRVVETTRPKGKIRPPVEPPLLTKQTPAYLRHSSLLI